MLAGGFLTIGPLAGFFISAILAGLVFFPAFAVSSRVAMLPWLLLPITGAVVGLLAAFVLSTRLDNFLFAVYLLFAFWGALGGYLFMFGVHRGKSA